MGRIILISGSPREVSRTDLVLAFLSKLAVKSGYETAGFSVRDVPAEDLLYGNFAHEDVIRIGEELQQADGVIIGSPVYKASYTGVLKALLDLVPQEALKGKPVLPIMTGGTIAHCLAIEYTLKPLIATLKGQSEQGVFVLDKVINKEDPSKLFLDADVEQRLHKSLYRFFTSIQKSTLTSV